MRSDISGFRKLTHEEKLQKVKEFAGLEEEDVALIRKTGSMNIDTASRMIENVLGTFELPFGVATNFLIDGKDYLIPMVLEEPSVVAAASYAAKLARPSGGFKTRCDEPIMIGQIQVVGLDDLEAAKKAVFREKQELIEKANRKDPILIKYGGGVTDLDARIIETPKGRMLIVDMFVNVSDAMGANIINTMAEYISSDIEEITGGAVRLCIVSNLAVKRLARASAVWKKESLEIKGLKGEDVVDRILDAYAFACGDPYRCSTHNKGIMNGIDAVTLATGNDFRAVEAGAHSYASFNTQYKPLTHYEKDEEGNLVGMIELPIAVGTVGGSTRTNDMARIALKILGVKSSKELASVLASIGLAQNFAAIRALATEGIQRGHMKLHAKNIAVMAGAEDDNVERVTQKMIEENNISVDRAREIVKEFT